MADVDQRDLTIGLDLGGTRAKAGLLDADGKVRARDLVEVPEERAEEAIIALLAELVQRLDPSGAAPVGIAAAGVMDQRRGLVRESPNFPEWHDFALGKDLADATGRRVHLENDANAVIFGEMVAGAARGRQHIVGYTLGTGVGGCLILGGELWRGARGMAGELGHVTVVSSGGRACPCGNRGCLEQYVGAVGIRRTLEERGGHLATLAASRDAPRALAEAAEAGDEAARAVFSEIGRYLGVAAAAAVHTLDVLTIVLAGGIASSAGLFVPALEEELRARTFKSMSEGVEVIVGSLDEDAGVVGVAALAQMAASADR